MLSWKYHNAFPDLQWLKGQIRRQFAERGGQGWPTVIIQAKTKLEHRPGLEGPLSLFMNLSGTSYAKADSYRLKIPDNCFFISNEGQTYDLDIDNRETTETFNFHLAAGSMPAFMRDMQTKPDRLLELDPTLQTGKVHFHNKLYPKTPALMTAAHALKETLAHEASALETEEAMACLLWQLLKMESTHLGRLQTLAPQRAVTRQELLRRLSRAEDHLRSRLTENISLEELAGAANLSKYHFLRMFTQAYSQTPSRFVTQLRLEKGMAMLRNEQLEVQDIALALGFSETAAFGRALRRQIGLSPMQYRQATSR